MKHAGPIISEEEHLNPEDPINISLSSVTALYPLSTSVQASRLGMSLSQRSQACPLKNSERPMIYHGIHDLESLKMGTKVPNDGEVIGIYHSTGGSPIVHILCVNHEERELFYIDIPYWIGNHTRFGFHPVPTDTLKNLTVGDHVTKGDDLTIPPTIDGDYFNTGVHLQTCTATLLPTAEDGVILNEDARWKLAYDTLIHFEFDLDVTGVLTNRYGDEERYQGMPQIGDIVPEDNVFCSIRKINKSGISSALDPTMLRRELRGDLLVQHHGIAGGRIVDISVVRNIHNQEYIKGDHVHQLMHYADATDSARKNMVAEVKRYQAEQRSRGIQYEPDTHLANMVIRDDIIETSRRRSHRVHLLNKDQVLAPWRIKVSVLHENVLPEIGAKITDGASGKATVVAIWPKERMPTDKHGVVAEVVRPKEAISDRAIPAIPHEAWINATVDKLSNTIRTVLGVYRMPNNHVYRIDNGERVYEKEMPELLKTPLPNVESPKKRINRCYAIIHDWFDKVNPDLGQVFAEAPMDVKKETLIETVYHNLITPIPIDVMNKIGAVNIAEMIDEDPNLCPDIGPVTFIDEFGKEITTKEDILISPIYYMILDKDAKDVSGANGHTRQAMGLPVVRAADAKIEEPISRLPVKTFGQDDMVIFSGALQGSENVPHGFIEYVDRITSPHTQKAEEEAILRSETPSGETTLVDRRKVPYGRGRAMEILNHILSIHGVKLKME
jgi:hypothetical protein